MVRNTTNEIFKNLQFRILFYTEPQIQHHEYIHIQVVTDMKCHPLLTKGLDEDNRQGSRSECFILTENTVSYYTH